MTTKTRYDLRIAEPVAERLVAELRPYCERIQIAGSIRRRKWDVGDIELLCIPKWRTETRSVDMFTTEEIEVDELDEFLMEVSTGDDGETLFYKRRKSTGHLAGFGPKNKLMADVNSGIPVDVFTTDERNWGMALVVRTGPAQFNIDMMARLKKLGHAGHAYGGITLNATYGATGRREVDCPDEETVFEHLKMAYQPPEARGA